MRAFLATLFLLIVVADALPNHRFKGLPNHREIKPLNTANAASNNNDTYMPCQRQLTLFFDTTTQVNSKTFKNVQDFLSNTFFSSFNHFERLILGVFGDSFLSYSNLNYFESLSEVQAMINRMSQEGDYSDMEMLFDTLANNIPQEANKANLTETIVLVVDSFTLDDVKNVDQYVKKMKNNGVFLSIIGVKKSIDVKVLDKVADFSYVLDVNSALPSDIQKVISQANGC